MPDTPPISWYPLIREFLQFILNLTRSPLIHANSQYYHILPSFSAPQAKIFWISEGQVRSAKIFQAKSPDIQSLIFTLHSSIPRHHTKSLYITYDPLKSHDVTQNQPSSIQILRYAIKLPFTAPQAKILGV